MAKTTSLRLEVAKEEIQKKEEIVEKQKTEAMATKCRNNRGEISLSNEKKSYDNNIADNDTDLDEANDKKLFLAGYNSY